MVRVYAVASAKGGVGKTTTTANLGAALAAAGRDVVVVDADISMANLGDALGVEAGDATVHDVLAGEATPREAARDGPLGLTVVAGSTALDAFRDADPAELKRLVEAFDDADYVLLDAGAGLSYDTGVPLGLADSVLLVSTTERAALVDTDKTREFAERLGAPVAGAILTRVDPAEPNAGEVSGRLDCEVLEAVPEDPAVREALAVGEPVVGFDSEAPAAVAYRSLAATLAGDPGAADSEVGPEGERDAVEETDVDDRADADEQTAEAATPTADDATVDDGETDDGATDDGEVGETEVGGADEATEPEVTYANAEGLGGVIPDAEAAAGGREASDVAENPRPDEEVADVSLADEAVPFGGASAAEEGADGDGDEEDADEGGADGEVDETAEGDDGDAAPGDDESEGGEKKGLFGRLFR